MGSLGSDGTLPDVLKAGKESTRSIRAAWVRRGHWVGGGVEILDMAGPGGLMSTANDMVSPCYDGSDQV